MNMLRCALMTLLLAGCGKECAPVFVNQPVPAPVPAETDIQKLVDDENSYREGQGQTALTPGLSCSVQQISSGGWMSTSSPGYPGSGVAVLTGSSYAFLLSTSFNEGSNNGPDTLLPAPLQPVFLNLNYKLSCSGQVVVVADGYHGFDMNSDDGSILTIDGAQVINNDGSHGMVDKVGTKFLRKGVHAFNLLYSQSGAGPHGLVLQMGGSVLPSANLFH